MKRTILAVGTAIALIGAQGVFAGPQPLDAEDSKVMPQPVVEQPCNWTGFYIGIHGGYGWGDLSIREIEEGEDDAPFREEPNGFFTGGQIGFNYQLGSFFVLGAEGELAWSGIGDESELLDSDEGETTFVDTDLEYLGTLSGRVGVTFWKNRLMAYAKGGVAFARFDYDVTEADEGESPEPELVANHDRTVPLIGFGLEHALTCHWSIKVEYKHFFIEDAHITRPDSDPEESEEDTFGIRTELDSVQVGVNYKF